MKWFDKLGIDASYLIIGTIVGIIILLIFFILCLNKINKLNKKYCEFMKGSNGETLESAILARFQEIDKLKQTTDTMSEKIKAIEETLLGTYQKMSVVKYDAFKEMGGKLSFSLALLDEENSGFILTSMHTREGCYTYVKEIIKGESFVILANEERTALEEAKMKHFGM